MEWAPKLERDLESVSRTKKRKPSFSEERWRFFFESETPMSPRYIKRRKEARRETSPFPALRPRSTTSSTRTQIQNPQSGLEMKKQ